MVLAYLDALIDALAVRDAAEVERLLSHPLARALSDVARAEAQAFRLGHADPLAAPLRVMQLRHQTAELLREVPVIADQPELPSRDPGRDGMRPTRSTDRPSRRAPLVQMELPLSA